MKISVIIPVLNERNSLPATIAALRACRGSPDGTADWVRAQPDLILVNSARGKGPQLNAGAARAIGDALLFLHADSELSPAALDALYFALSEADRSGPQFSTATLSTSTLSASALGAPNLSVTK